MSCERIGYLKKGKARTVKIGSATVGGDSPIAVQSMCATRTRDIDATVRQAEELRKAGAAIVRIAIDNDPDVEALKEIRKQAAANLCVDLQENYRLAEKLAPYVQKIRYNPGHLHHIERDKTIPEKVAWIAHVARDHGCALRVGVNCGSVDPDFLRRTPNDGLTALVESARYHCDLLDSLDFRNYVVSLKDSDPFKVIDANRRFAKLRPDVPLHLGVTEAGLPPDGIIKTRLAFEKLLVDGIGDTIRVSLTLPNDRKHEEVTAGYKILEDTANGRFISVPDFGKGLNIISCPSCSRVENEKFVELAEKVREITAYAARHRVTIAVMGCRVNGPGETDDADLGLWCGAQNVRLKRKTEQVGIYSYDEVLGRLRTELDKLIVANSPTLLKNVQIKPQQGEGEAPAEPTPMRR